TSGVVRAGDPDLARLAETQRRAHQRVAQPVIRVVPDAIHEDGGGGGTDVRLGELSQNADGARAPARDTDPSCQRADHAPAARCASRRWNSRTYSRHIRSPEGACWSAARRSESCCWRSVSNAETT